MADAEKRREGLWKAAVPLWMSRAFREVRCSFLVELCSAGLRAGVCRTVLTLGRLMDVMLARAEIIR